MDNINFNRLRELYYGTNTPNVDSVKGLYSAAKPTHQANQTKYTERQVREFLRKQETYQVDLAFKEPKKNRRNHVRGGWAWSTSGPYVFST